ncbi:hypothetical protein [Spiroplasma taiwanense]|uniref:Uncharacterized protein n=1 Tax=Spiroplasma taiwanense CT-1 TaxID=1276220 RepID=S5LSU1_9MOLU|nr:hypothetical protein [Spiroplasma taiwanense]AGR40729.1 hypothetical protein STAIW_v1c00320 [Spiroplasma taiwanense CT-1]
MNFSVENIIYVISKKLFKEQAEKVEIQMLSRIIVSIINKEFVKMDFLRIDKEDLITNVYLALCEVKKDLIHN